MLEHDSQKASNKAQDIVIHFREERFNCDHLRGSSDNELLMVSELKSTFVEESTRGYQVPERSAEVPFVYDMR